MINEYISAKETFRVSISTSCNERRNSALVQTQNNFAEMFIIMLSNKIAFKLITLLRKTSWLPAL